MYKDMDIWFACGSQDLYGAEVLSSVRADAEEVVRGLRVPAAVLFKGVLTSAVDITRFCDQANGDPRCGGVILWMHTFSPAKMWISGLRRLSKPMLHLHTQFRPEIPWQTLDMDYMNTHQSAHGDREFGHVCARLMLRRKVVVGPWQDPKVNQELADWVRVVAGARVAATLRVARFGDNMRNVAVTEGDKVEAQLQFGYEVHGFGIGDLVASVAAVGKKEVDALIHEYQQRYDLSAELRLGGSRHESLRDSARIEIGLESFLKAGNFQAFSTCFEALHGMSQLPGMPVQRLMEKGYGFGAEGDWKSAALVRIIKEMGQGMGGGTSFMEDYIYHFHPQGDRVLGAHMLEICPSIAQSRSKVELHPLGIGGKDDPVRMVFSAAPGAALNVCVVDLGTRFRYVIHQVEVVDAPETPKLPVARAIWRPLPDLRTSAAAWILAGGSHHFCFSKDVSVDMLLDYAEITGTEAVVIDHDTTLARFKNELRWNQAAPWGA